MKKGNLLSSHKSLQLHGGDVSGEQWQEWYSLKSKTVVRQGAVGIAFSLVVSV